MNDFITDASALGKRYVPERGDVAMDHLLNHVEHRRLRCLTVGALETLSIIMRHRNRGTISDDAARLARDALKREVFTGKVVLVSVADDLVFASAEYIERYSINSTDAILLRAALDIRAELLSKHGDLVLVSSDHRLLSAAESEGLKTYNPESEDIAALRALSSAP